VLFFLNSPVSIPGKKIFGFYNNKPHNNRLGCKSKKERDYDDEWFALDGDDTMIVPLTFALLDNWYTYEPAFWLNVYLNALVGIIGPELNIPVLFPIVIIDRETLSLFTKDTAVPGRTISVWGVNAALVI
jgi:hypothetical protein